MKTNLVDMFLVSNSDLARRSQGFSTVARPHFSGRSAPDGRRVSGAGGAATVSLGQKDGERDRRADKGWEPLIRVDFSRKSTVSAELVD